MHSSQKKIQSIHHITGTCPVERQNAPAAPSDGGLIFHSNPNPKTPKEETP
jgi:hypothetical protein